MDFLQIKYFFENNMQYTDGELDFYKILNHFLLFRRYWNSKKKKVNFFLILHTFYIFPIYCNSFLGWYTYF